MSRPTIFHGAPSPTKFEKARQAAPSFQHGAQWSPSKMVGHDWPWFLDNGAFVAIGQGAKSVYVGTDQEEWFHRRLDEAEAKMPRSPEFVVVPDLPGYGGDSLTYSEAWLVENDDWGLPTMPRDHPLYLPVQAGTNPYRAAKVLDRHDLAGLFIAGDQPAHRGNIDLYRRLADEHGANLHVGRPGTSLTWAIDAGVDSVDTTSIVRHGYWDRLENLEATIATGTKQGSLGAYEAGHELHA